MTILIQRALFCPTVFLLGIVVLSSAVDPVDFLESLKDDDDISQKDASSTEYPNGVNVIPGQPDVNYPILSSVPKSSFSCIGRPAGYYADAELRCQVWHICDEERRQQSFLCTNGTVYSQDKRVCDWWYNVNCDPGEVSRSYERNHELFKGPPPKPENAGDGEGSRKNEQQKETVNKNNQSPESPQPSSFSAFHNQHYKKPVQTTPQSPPPTTTRRTTTTTTYRPPTTYSTRPPPAALQNNPFYTQTRPSTPSQNYQTPSQSPPKQSSFPSSSQSKQSSFPASSQPKSPFPSSSQPSSFPAFSSPPKQSSFPSSSQPKQNPFPSSSSPPKQSSFPFPPPPRPGSTTEPAQPSLKTFNENGKKIVELRIPISQVPPEVLAKYGKRIPEHILKEIFDNFTRGQQLKLQQEALNGGKPNNPTGAGNRGTPPPKSPIPQSPSSSKKPFDFGPPSPSSSHSFSNSNPAQRPNNNNNNSPSQNKPFSHSNSAPRPNDNNHSPSPSSSAPASPSQSEIQQRFRHSTPRRTDGVKFATPTRELLSDFEQVGESQNPIYSLQQLFSGNSRFAGAKSANTKDFSFDDPAPPPSPRRRTQTPPPPPTYPPSTTTTPEPKLITDRYIPVASREEKKLHEQKRILLITKQGGKVATPVRVFPGEPEPYPPQLTPRRVPQDFNFKKIPLESFEGAESRYPIHSNGQRQRPTTPPTTTTTPPAPAYQEHTFSRKPKQNVYTPPPSQSPNSEKDSNNDYDDEDDGSPKEPINKEELELLRLAQEYVDITGQNFGVKQPKSA